MRFRFGSIDATDYVESAKECKCRVYLDDKSPGVLTQPLPVLQSFAGIDKAYFMPKPGDRVVTVLDDNAEEGFIAGAIYTRQTPPPVVDANKHRVNFQDGSFAEYDKSQQQLIIEVAPGTKAIEIRADGNTKIKLLSKGSDVQLLLESLGKIVLAAKENLEIYSDQTILLDAIGGTTIVDPPNPRPPYFPDRADDWLQT